MIPTKPKRVRIRPPRSPAGTRPFRFSATRTEDIRRGYDFSAFTSLAERLVVPKNALSVVAGIPPTTLHRREAAGRLDPHESERLYLIGSLFELAQKVLESADAAQAWFTTPQLALDNSTPLSRCATIPGADEVKDLLLAIEHGVYA
jgi:putative toxin-antitoxin system antitoxin component (TIGR02293 family)